MSCWYLLLADLTVVGRRRARLAVEWLGNRLNEAEVVDQQAGVADHEIAVFGDVRL